MHPPVSHEASRTRLVWHRKGSLRLHDNELYHHHHHHEGLQILSLYIINPKDYELRPVVSTTQAARDESCMDDWTTATEGPHASRALVGALQDLRHNLRGLGSDLVIQRGNPLEILPMVAQSIQADEVVWSEVPGYYERILSERMKKAMGWLHVQQQGQGSASLQTVASYTLFHPEDLPYGQDAWSRLARPNEQRSKKKKKTKGSNNSHHDATNADKSSGQQSLHQSYVDCSPHRWEGLPRIMGDFRRAARTHAKVRPCFPPPSKDCLVSTDAIQEKNLQPGDLPTMEELTKSFQHSSLFGMSLSISQDILAEATTEATPTDPILFPGGETQARSQWNAFLNEHAATADRSLADTSIFQSAHISTSLALGVLSPRHIYWSVVEHQRKLEHQQRQQCDNREEAKDRAFSPCQWLVSHMEMRDYFLCSAFSSDKKLYSLNGQQPVHKNKQKRRAINHKRNNNSGDIYSTMNQANDGIIWQKPTDCPELYRKWALGKTGLPLVDAGMNELITTGYCSNRVRQNMASVLTKDLHIDWRIGAEWFQFWLQDHCVAANWGNWQYFSGVGGDPKNRHFKTVSQALRYDPAAVYVQKWLPKESSSAVLEFLQSEEWDDGDNLDVWFRPWDFIQDWGSIVDPSTQYTWQDKQRLEETGGLVAKAK